MCESNSPEYIVFVITASCIYRTGVRENKLFKIIRAATKHSLEFYESMTPILIMVLNLTGSQCNYLRCNETWDFQLQGNLTTLHRVFCTSCIHRRPLTV